MGIRFVRYRIGQRAKQLNSSLWEVYKLLEKHNANNIMKGTMFNCKYLIEEAPPEYVSPPAVWLNLRPSLLPFRYSLCKRNTEMCIANVNVNCHACVALVQVESDSIPAGVPQTNLLRWPSEEMGEPGGFGNQASQASLVRPPGCDSEYANAQTFPVTPEVVKTACKSWRKCTTLQEGCASVRGSARAVFRAIHPKKRIKYEVVQRTRHATWNVVNGQKPQMS